MEEAWWLRNNLRLIQNNLRESDANLDVDRLIDDLQKLSANTLMMNAGGIVAFYPTELDYHYRAAGQTKDLLGEAVAKAHANGMKFIARFDFSKAHESIYAQHPEWFYRTRQGEPVNYYGIVHTCVNGWYQQQHALHMIDEVISRYEVDGIFFNMFGYQTWDYSGRQYGTCHCDNCKARFRAMYGLDLPASDRPDDPVYPQYREFQEKTTRMMLDAIHDLVGGKRKDVAISTYHEHKVDIVRKESNTEVGRPYPLWPYSASENVKSLEDSWDDKTVSNCCINAVGLVHRFTGVSRHEVNIRLKESLASGSGLDFCIIGVFEDYPDRENLDTVAEIFRYHRSNERYYGRFLSMADIALIKPGHAFGGGQEYLGLFKMLKEHHLLFDVVHQHTLAERSDLGRYKAVIVPGIASMGEAELRRLEEAGRQGARLIATGGSFVGDEASRAMLRRVFGIAPERAHTIHKEAAYLLTEDKRLFKRFARRDWIFLGEMFHRVTADAGVELQLPYVDAATFGPPERAFGHRVNGAVHGAAIRREGELQAAYLPWQPGTLYYKHGFADHKHVVLDLLEHMAGADRPVDTNAPQTTELFFDKLDDRTYMLHLLNLSGFNGTTYFEPLPVRDVRVTLRGIGAIASVETLAGEAGVSVSFASAGGEAEVRLPALGDFAALLVRTEGGAGAAESDAPENSAASSSAPPLGRASDGA